MLREITVKIRDWCSDMFCFGRMCNRAFIFAKNELEINFAFTFGVMFFGIFVFNLSIGISKVHDLQKQTGDTRDIKCNRAQKQKASD